MKGEMVKVGEISHAITKSFYKFCQSIIVHTHIIMQCIGMGTCKSIVCLLSPPHVFLGGEIWNAYMEKTGGGCEG